MNIFQGRAEAYFCLAQGLFTFYQEKVKARQA
jgi:hypothetical protein